MQSKFVSIVGAGGKTTALRALMHELSAQRVLATTSTHIFPIAPPNCRITLTDPSPDALLDQLRLPGVVCAGKKAKDGKLCSLSPALLAQTAEAADIVLCEADGAHCHPLKLHRSDEPVLPPQTDLVLIIAGLSALGQPVYETVHRYMLHPDWATHPEQIVGVPELLHCVQETAAACKLPADKLRVLLNQADTPTIASQAEPIAQLLRADGLDCRIGSLRTGLSLADWLFP